MIIRWVKNGSSLRQHRTLALGQMKQWTAASSAGPAVTVVYKKTRSLIGTKVGSRQAGVN